MLYFEGILDYADRSVPAGVGGAAATASTSACALRQRLLRARILRSVSPSPSPTMADGRLHGHGPANAGASRTARSATPIRPSTWRCPPSSIPPSRATPAPFAASTSIAPQGTIVNPRPPAALTMCTVLPAREIIHACWMALGAADPSAQLRRLGRQLVSISAGNTAEGRTYVMYHWAGSSGGGAVRGRDGFPQQGGLNSLCGAGHPKHRDLRATLSRALRPARVAL